MKGVVIIEGCVVEYVIGVRKLFAYDADDLADDLAKTP